MNPKRRKRRSTRRRKRHVAVANPIRRKRRTRRRRNPVYAIAPRRHRRARRRHRRNPVSMSMFRGGIDLKKPQTLLVPIGVGVVANMAVSKIPAMFGIVSPLPKYGVQAAVAIGGGLALRGFLGHQNAAIWAVVAGVNIVTNMLNTYVFKTAMLSEYPMEMMTSYPAELSMDAYPEEIGGEDLSAYPEEFVSPY